MDYKVIFKEGFLQDLGRIVKAIAANNPDAAHNLGKLIIQTSGSLNFLPERHPEVRQRPGIRRFVVKHHYKVLYRVLEDIRVVEILRCWDGRREKDPQLSD